MRVIVALVASVLVVGLAVAAVVRVGAEAPPPPPATTMTTTTTPGDGRVAAEVVDFLPDYGGPGRVAVMGAVPVDPDDPTRAGHRPATPGVTYVAVTGLTGCRVPTHAELWRAGATVHARFTGGVDRPECFRAVTPFAQFAVDARALQGVTAVSDD
jgi:hypothetical protein